MSPLVNDPVQIFQNLYKALYPDQNIFVTVDRDRYSVFNVDNPADDPNVYGKLAFERMIERMQAQVDAAEPAADADPFSFDDLLPEDDETAVQTATDAAEDDDPFAAMTALPSADDATDDDRAAALAELETAPENALDDQIARMTSNALYGIQIYYTIWSKVWLASDLETAADAVNAEGDLPQSVFDFIKRTVVTKAAAYRKAASIKGKGIKTAARNDHELSVIKTEPVPDLDGTYLMYIKSVASDGIDDAELEYTKVGLLLHDPDEIDATSAGIVWKPEPGFAIPHNDPQLQQYERVRIKAVNGTVQAVRDKYNTLHGKINDVQIRQNLLLPWLKELNRICVRASGGVYVVPLRRETSHERTLERQAIVNEIEAMQKWLDTAGVGEMTLAAMYDGKLSPMPQHRQAAILELTDELKIVAESLPKYEGVQASTRKSSALAMLKRLDDVQAQIARLNETFTEDVTIKGVQVDSLRAAAKRLVAESDKELANARTARAEAKRKAEIKGGDEPLENLHVNPDDEIAL